MERHARQAKASVFVVESCYGFYSPMISQIQWNRLPCRDNPLDLAATLKSGQCFRWSCDENGVWWNTIEDTILAVMQPEGAPYGDLLWQTFPNRNNQKLVNEYFRFDVNINSFLPEWMRSETRTIREFENFKGLRLLRQPPLECFISFQCSSCNTVIKIERSVQYLVEKYGDCLTSELPFTINPKRFPSLSTLGNAEESVLRAGQWGYRAPRVIQLARTLQEKPVDWLNSLKELPYTQSHEALAALPGIGPKLADCICLFSLDKVEAVPVDTHVRKIGTRLFRNDLLGKSLTPKVYSAIADSFREKFGSNAGWAQQILFYAETHSRKSNGTDNSSF